MKPTKSRRGKTNLFRIIFSRKTLGAVTLALQIILIAECLLRLQAYGSFIYGALSVLTAILIIYELNRDNEPAFREVWIILMAVFPLFGVFVYLYIRISSVNRRIQKRFDAIGEITKPLLMQSDEVTDLLSSSDSSVPGVFSYLYKTAGYPANKNTSVKYFPSGEAAFDEILTQLEKAESYIFLEFFIISEGRFWNSVLDILKRKVKEGVEVRLLYDGMGCMPHLDSDYPNEMKQLGIKCKVFSPIVPFLSTYQNNRDHRKILVVDGKVAFTGGINLSDEYINEYKRFGHWKDSAVMLSGDGVRSFSMMFLTMWNLTEKAPENYEKYAAVSPDKSAHGYVIPFADSPLDEEHVSKNVYLDILYSAKKYVHIMTPYLVLDTEMMGALKYAARRGVDVKIIMPHIPDKWYAFTLARTYYPDLIKAGVKIYEYTPGFVHSKISVSDGKAAVVGSINHDFRSLYLHYECGAFLYDVPEIADIENDVRETLRQCHLFTPEDYKKIHWYVRAFGRVLRILAPLM